MDVETVLENLHADVIKVIKNLNQENTKQTIKEKIKLMEKTKPIRNLQHTEHLFKKKIPELLKCGDIAIWDRYVDYAIVAAKAELCPLSLPSVLLWDVTGLLPYQNCEQLFSIVESKIDIWTSQQFFGSSKNHLLRMCNELLSRAARNLNNIFAGRVLLFLSMVFPFAERSGLNLLNEFNTDCAIEFMSDDEEETEIANSEDLIQEIDETRRVGERREFIRRRSNHRVERRTSVKRMKLNNSFYKKFWSLQNYFQNPYLCYTSQHFSIFQVISNSVLKILYQYKSVKSSNETDVALGEGEGNYVEHVAKYLTRRSLLSGQLQDPNFRKCVLTQMLIIFHCLVYPSKSKLDEQLTADQTLWLNRIIEKTCVVMEHSVPDGKRFLNFVLSVLKNEELWLGWKNSGCNELKKPVKRESSNAHVSHPANVRKRRRYLGTLAKISAQNGKRFMYQKKLNELWNICPNNMEACENPDFCAAPKITDYFEGCIEEAEDELIKEEDKKLSSEIFSWRGLKLMLDNSAHFYSTTSMVSEPVPTFLENLLAKMIKMPADSLVCQEHGHEINTESEENVREGFSEVLDEMELEGSAE